MEQILVTFGIAAGAILLLISALALALRNRPSGHCGLCGQEREGGCSKLACPQKAKVPGLKQHNP